MFYTLHLGSTNKIQSMMDKRGRPRWKRAQRRTAVKAAAAAQKAGEIKKKGPR